jgi:cation diffusion facilitator CzcD-associated flavoprotein CzcO
MSEHTPLLIIGAGPFGLSLDRYASAHDLPHMTLGKPMDFWKTHMPGGMYLRSASDWHLDPINEHTIEAYLATRGQTPADVEPLSLDFYLGYCDWFLARSGYQPDTRFVQRLDRNSVGGFEAKLDSGERILAEQVVLAMGFGASEHVPAELAEMIPAERLSHTRDFVDLQQLAGKRCVIIGGRQSAFEWAGLLAEAGVTAVHVVHRHATPKFTEADWTWATPLVDQMAEDPAWFRNLSADEKDAINARMWGEGRLKLEPWLWPRLDNDQVHLWPEAQISACQQGPDGRLNLALGEEQLTEIDQVILATGYRVDVNRFDLLRDGNLLNDLAAENGFPKLDPHFQTSIPGLYMTSLPAAQDFGPFFGFTISVRTSATVIGRALLNRRN